MRLLFKTALAAAATLALAAPAAVADTTVSSNWAGYAVHRPGVKYRQVTANWRQPGARCAPGQGGYSAVWLGLGGYSDGSDALEQIGTEVDCKTSGQIRSSAWYEIVPAPSHPVNLAVRPGDLIQASVKVVGTTVSLKLSDATTHRSFTRTLHPDFVDVSSAEWIVEAPSDCISATICQTLPLADFGTASFGSATAVSTAGHGGSIADRSWKSTKIDLIPGGRRFISNGSASNLAGAATTSTLTPAGNAFTVSFAEVALPGQPAFTRRAAVLAGHLVHPLR